MRYQEEMQRAFTAFKDTQERLIQGQLEERKIQQEKYESETTTLLQTVKSEYETKLEQVRSQNQQLRDELQVQR